MEQDIETEPEGLSSSSSLEWTAQFVFVPDDRTLPGDKIRLPQEALEQLLAAAPTVVESGRRDSRSTFDPFNPYTFSNERNARSQAALTHQQLPYPLTFRLVNPDNGRSVYAGIKEFSAGSGQVGMSPFLQQALAIKLSEGATPRVTVHAKQVPKGTFVKLRPLEAGYDPEDWRALLEDHMRKNYTTLTKGEVLAIPNRGDNYRFLIESFLPEADAICVVDTDLEVDIEALDEEQARATLTKIAAKRDRERGTKTSSSTGGTLDLLRTHSAQVVPGEYVDYEIPSWAREAGLEIDVAPEEPGGFCVLANPYGNRQRTKPRIDEHCFADFEYPPGKKLRLAPTSADLVDAEAVWVSVHVPAGGPENSPIPRSFRIRAGPISETDHVVVESSLSPDDVQCHNCQQPVPKQSFILHQNFCLRNNVLCSRGCGIVFKKNSEAFANHSHCLLGGSCDAKEVYFDSQAAHEGHVAMFHTHVFCPSCGLKVSNTPLLAAHRTSICPGKLILCRFCHLEVPQDSRLGVEGEVMLTGLTPHELEDGARTTECHLCGRITRLRDLDSHLRHHEFERRDRPVPRICRNINCGRTIDGTNRKGQTRGLAREAGNDIGLCATCFGPLYVSMHDPESKALKRRVERRYLGQLLSGCGKAWCRNDFCKMGRVHTRSQAESVIVSTKDALPTIKPHVDGLLTDNASPLHFCVDERSQRSRLLAELLTSEEGKLPGQKRFGLGWCLGALEAEDGDITKATEWLRNFAQEEGQQQIE